MTKDFDLRLYVGYLARRSKTLAIVPAVAVAMALLVSLALPKQYDATVTLLIQPGGSDPRYPPPLNQVYLEYLRSYEYVVQGDELLTRVLKEFQLDRDPYNYNLTSFRRSVLDVQLLKFSKLLSVRVRFEDPQKAHQIALFLAHEATRATEAWRDADAEKAIRQAERDLEGPRARLAEAEKQLENFRRGAREDELARTVQMELENKSEYERQLGSTQVLIPELEARVAALTARIRETPEKIELDKPVLNPAAQRLRGLFDEASTSLAGERAKQTALRRSLAEIEAPLARHQTELVKVQARATELERVYHAAREALTLATNRANDARLGAVSRTEQLQIADPGIVPQSPSSPHMLLNALLALVLGLLGAVAYETWIWNGGKQGEGGTS